MHFSHHVTPLLVRSMKEPLTYALMPVPLLALATSNPELLAQFFKPRGKMVCLHEDDALRVRKYMQRHNTEALTSDGITAFSLHGNQLLECDPAVCGQPPERLKVRFCPQDWIGGVATSTSPPEPVDVTELVLQMRADEIAAIRDGQPEAAALVDSIARGHFGPYSVLCESDICVFFRINSITELTQEVLDTRRCGLTPKRQVLAHEVEAGGSVWMLGVGLDKLHFAVRADDIDHAISECRQTFPGQPVLSACSIA